MEKKIFISHSSLDTEIGEKFVDALLEIGIPKEMIFYSSKYHTGVEVGLDFQKVIMTQIKSGEIVIFLLTKNFYNSAACLNEMGAAWILEKEIMPILLGNLKPSDMRGFIDSHYIAITPKSGEEYKLLSKLNSFIVKRNTQKNLQEIFVDFLTEANKISEYSEQYTNPTVVDMNIIEEAMVKRHFTDAEILLLNYFKKIQNNRFVIGSDADFDAYLEEYGGFDYKTAIRLLNEEKYLYTSDINNINLQQAQNEI